MALVLGRQKGKGIYIGTEKFTVSDIISPSCFVLTDEQDTRYTIKDGEDHVKVRDKVFIGCGNTGDLITAKVMIDAPKHIEIWREELYDKARNNNRRKNRY